MCKRTMYKRARIPMFLWERRACSNSGAQAVFSLPRKKRPGNEASSLVASFPGRFLRGREKTAWAPLFAHAWDIP